MTPGQEGEAIQLAMQEFLAFMSPFAVLFGGALIALAAIRLTMWLLDAD